MSNFNEKLVYIVESNPIHLAVLKEVLNQANCNYICFNETSALLGELSETPPDLLLLNFKDPNIDCEEIVLFAANNPNIKIYGLTANEGELSQKQAYTKGNIKLPTTKSVLVELLKEVDGELPLLDQTVIQSIRDLAGDDDPDFLKNLVKVYLGRAPSLIKDITAAVTKADNLLLERSAHSLKGSSGNLGAKSLMKICEELERLGREQKVEQASALMDDLNKTFTAVKEELEKELIPLAS